MRPAVDARVEPGDARIEPGDARIEPGDARIEPGDAQVEPGDAQVEPRDAQVAPIDMAIDPTDARVEPVDMSVDQPDAAAPPSDMAVAAPDMAAPLPDMALPIADAAVQVPDMAVCVPALEVCNGADDDCDGQTDEDFPDLAQPCGAGLGACFAEGVWRCDGQGAIACSAVAGAPADETCNGLDDDCDGRVDDDPEGLGLPCTVGEGACARDGAGDCVDGQVACDVEPGQGADETCDGTDEDCDGSVDEDFDLRQPCTVGIGGCAREGLTVCGAAHDAVVCDAQAGAPVDEACNGIDDDCNGSVDETFVDLGAECTEGLGPCAEEGHRVCDAAGDGTVCDAVPRPPAAETCNGIDDDCSGAADDFEPQQVDDCGVCGHVCEVSNGEAGCAHSTCIVARCFAGWLDYDGLGDNGCEEHCLPTTPPTEVCDGVDNDCNGEQDEAAACAFDLFDFCRRRRGVTVDTLCEDFPSDALDAWTNGSPALPGDATPEAPLGRYAPALGDVATGGGHLRTLNPVSGTFRLSFAVRYARSTAGAGLFRGTTRLDGDAANPGYGYAVEVGPGEAGDPVVRVVRQPEGEVLATVGAPDLADGAKHRVLAEHAADARWGLFLDGRRLPADLTDEAEDPYPDFDRVTIFAAAVAAAPGTQIDDLAVEVDPDGDARFAPQDNCPDVFNPDQLDPDANGRGIACDDADADGVEDDGDLCVHVADPAQIDSDGDGLGDACDTDGRALLVGLDPSWAPGPWTVDPITALRHRLYQPSPGHEMVAAEPGPSGRLVYVRDDVLRVGPQDGSEGIDLALGAAWPQWLANGRILYHSLDATTVSSILPDGSDSFPEIEADLGDIVRVFAVRGGTALVVLRQGDGEVEATVRDLDFQVTAGPVALPPTASGMPWLDLHPTEPTLLFAAVDGVFHGVATIDLDTGAFIPVSAQQTFAARWLAGDRFVALEQIDLTHARVVVRATTDPLTVSTLVPTTALLRSDVLDWVEPADDPGDEDADVDGINDASDPCVGLAAYELPTPVALDRVNAATAPRAAIGWSDRHQRLAFAWSSYDNERARMWSPRTGYTATRVFANRTHSYAGEYARCAVWTASSLVIPFDNRGGLYTQRLDPAGALVGGNPRFNTATGDNFMGCAQDADGAIVIAVEGNNQPDVTRVADDGTRLVATGLVDFGDSLSLVRTAPGTYVHYDGINTARFLGENLLETRRVGVDAHDGNSWGRMAFDGQRIAVAVPRALGGSRRVQFRTYTPEMVPLGGGFTAGGGLTDGPVDVAAGPDGWGMVWAQSSGGVTNVYFDSATPDGVRRSAPSLLIDRADVRWAEPRITWAGDRWAVAWGRRRADNDFDLTFAHGTLQCR